MRKTKSSVKGNQKLKNSNHVVPDKTEGQTYNRRSPNIDDSSSTSSSANNIDYSHRTRIPSSWVTTTTTTTPKPSTTRAPLRTTTGGSTRATKIVSKRVNNPSTIRAPSPYQPVRFYFANF